MDEVTYTAEQMQDLRRRLQAAEAERDRYKAALDRIADGGDRGIEMEYGCNLCPHFMRIADDALSGT